MTLTTQHRDTVILEPVMIVMADDDSKWNTRTLTNACPATLQGKLRGVQPSRRTVVRSHGTVSEGAQVGEGVIIGERCRLGIGHLVGCIPRAPARYSNEDGASSLLYG